MRKFSILLTAILVSSCMGGPLQPSPAQVAQSQEKFAKLTAGKVAGAPLSCLPSFRSSDMVVIDDDTIAFRNGPSQVYVNHMQGGGCLNLDGGRNTLVTRIPGPNLCRGDIAQVVDLPAGITVGSCVFGDFVPYKRVR
ncbi:hypothetical protein [Sphingomonas sp. URHD0057]|uniref:hypothetical protein n=1 Tax=Sphingomonas sp. URHD0057 TaxID=1380389 RepID=UPI000AAF91F0|nr:hypothetical protein [Sphingomonas sp. URHD0057]